MPHIVLTGTESTYKSRLCAALSELFQLPAVPEYARHYMSENGIMASNVNEAGSTPSRRAKSTNNASMAILMRMPRLPYSTPMESP